MGGPGGVAGRVAGVGPVGFTVAGRVGVRGGLEKSCHDMEKSGKMHEKKK